MSVHLDGFIDKPVYILVCRTGDNINDGSLERIIMSVFSTEIDANRAKEWSERRAEENGFGDYERYYVEAWRVHEPSI